MTNRTLYRVLVGLFTISLVSSVGFWSLSYIPEGYPEISFAIVLALLIPALVVPRLLARRFETRSSRTALTFFVTFGVVMVILVALVPPDAVLAAYATVAALVVALPVTYLIVTYEIDRYLFE